MAGIQFGKELKFSETSIDGLIFLDVPVHGDNRGWFKESFQRAKMTTAKSANANAIPDFKIVQNNISFNAKRGVTRGIHAEPWDKFITVASGSVFGAWVDLRASSKTYGKVVTQIITPDIAVFVPRGVANSFQALEDNTAYTYLVNDHWSADADYTFVNLADPDLSINWPIPLTSQEVELSEKDKNHPLFKNAKPMMPRKTLVVGSNGQLGRAVKEFVSQNHLEISSTFEFVDIDEFDFTNEEAYSSRNWAQYSTIINCAAFTGVDAAETEEGKKAAWKGNAKGPSLLAKIATEFNLTLVHISSDYVFDGTFDGEHLETEELSPLGVYGQTKAAGDTAVSTTPRHYILRTSWVIGNGNNFAKTFISLAEKGINPEVVFDQRGRLTFTQTLASAIFHLLEKKAEYGVYNLSNDGEVVSWCEIAKEIYKLCGRDEKDVSEISTEKYFENAVSDGKIISPRPSNSALSLEKIKKTKFQIPSWKECLRKYVESEIKQN